LREKDGGKPMKENPSERDSTATILVALIQTPDLITACPKCGGEVGLWSEDKETICIFCNHQIFALEGTIH